MKEFFSDSHRYDDIMDLSRPVSRRYPPMSNAGRAAQFFPFDALGFQATMKEEERQTQEKIVLDEDAREDLDRRLSLLRKEIDKHPEVTVTWFVPDERKEGGAYTTDSGRVKKLEESGRFLILEGGVRIPLEDIFSLSGAFLEETIL